MNYGAALILLADEAELGHIPAARTTSLADLSRFLLLLGRDVSSAVQNTLYSSRCTKLEVPPPPPPHHPPLPPPPHPAFILFESI